MPDKISKAIDHLNMSCYISISYEKVKWMKQDFIFLFIYVYTTLCTNDFFYKYNTFFSNTL